MSLEQILKSGAQKRRQKAARKRHNGIAAHDSKYTGDEPIWDGWETWTVDKFMQERNRALNFYNYYTTSKDLKPAIVDWMIANGFSKEDVKSIKRCPDYYPGTTTGSLCSAINRGMPPLHPRAQEYHDRMPGVGGTARSDELFIRERIKHAIEHARTIAEPIDPVVAALLKEKGISPMERLRQKVQSTIIMDLDVILDSWMTPETPIVSLQIYEKMRGHELPGAACAQIETWLSKNLVEMKAALDKTDADAVQGYSYLTTKQLSDRVSALSEAIVDLTKHKHTIKAARAPRAKKVHSAIKQTERLKYCKQDNDLKLTSVNPVRLIGAYRLLAYNRKYRILFDYVCTSTSGFGVKGTTLQNVDELKSRYIRLRKPDEVLPLILTNTSRQIDKVWAGLTTKEGKPKNRINEDVILVRVFEQPTE